MIQKSKWLLLQLNLFGVKGKNIKHGFHDSNESMHADIHLVCYGHRTRFIPDKKKEKRNAFSRGFLCFSELDQIFQGGGGRGGVKLKNRMSQIFQYEVWLPSVLRHTVHRQKKRNAYSNVTIFQCKNTINKIINGVQHIWRQWWSYLYQNTCDNSL